MEPVQVFKKAIIGFCIPKTRTRNSSSESGEFLHGQSPVKILSFWNQIKFYSLYNFLSVAMYVSAGTVADISSHRMEVIIPFLVLSMQIQLIYFHFQHHMHEHLLSFSCINEYKAHTILISHYCNWLNF